MAMAWRVMGKNSRRRRKSRAWGLQGRILGRAFPALMQEKARLAIKQRTRPEAGRVLDLTIKPNNP
jgi:hypothetical protein